MANTSFIAVWRTLWRGLFFMTAGCLGGQPSESLPVHDLDPYPVQSWGTGALAERLDLVEAGRLFLGEGAGRAGTWISEEGITGTGAARVEDLFWQIPGAATQARFGVITVPTLRGDAAETLFNGQRRGDNLFGLPLTMTAVESVEVVLGPPLVEAGLGKRTGGMVNLTTKRPVLGQVFGSVEIRLGTWVPGGGSFTTLEGTADWNLALSPNQALRLAVGWRDDETFYARNGGRDDYADLYVAWRWEGEDGSSLDLMGTYHELDRPQTLGVNRPWQGLIDDGLYVSGEVDALIGRQDPPGFLDPGVADPGLLTAGPGDLVRIPADRVLMSVGDIGRGEAYLGQLIFQKPLQGDLQFQQHALVERVFREKLNQFYFAEDVEQLTVDTRSELSGRGESAWGPLSWEAGLHLRLEERENRANYWNEFAYAFDLMESRRFSAPEAFGAFLAPGAVTGSGGRSWYLPSSAFSTPESTDSRIRQAGAYGTVEQALAGGWRLAASLRADWLEIEATEPGNLGLATRLSDEETVRLLSGSLSLQRQWERARVYLSAGTFRGLAGSTVGDGVNLHAGGQLHREDFLNRARLVELGGQVDLSDSLMLAWTVYDQKRRRMEFFGANDIVVRGAEVAMNWQPRPATRFSLNGNYLDARYDNAAPAEFGGGSLWNVYAPGAGPTGEGLGFGYIGGFFLNSVAPGDHRLPGLSKWQVNAGLEQAFGQNWLLRLWGGWASDQMGNLAGEYWIPSQMEWNASLTCSIGRWEGQVVARNLFDADNWLHNGDTFFDQMLISRNQPLRFEGRLRMRF